ncbi:MAG TPA: hypothetical protein VNM90_00600 [Haliangium sp.]|nr:hypothetical protein [Haliangium sp.]
MRRNPLLQGAAERVHVPLDERCMAVLGLGLAGFLAWLAYGALAHKLSVPTDIPGSPRYVAGEWAGHVADMAWVAVLIAGAAWLTGACLRGAVGIPLPLRQPRPWVRVLRVGAIAAILIRMSIWSAMGGHGARFAGVGMTVDLALLHGLALCALAGFELPAWVARGVQCLRARIPALAAQRASLAALPAGGRVRVAGTVATEGLDDGLDGGVAYRRAWDAQAQRVELHGQPFQLRDGGHRVWIDLDATRAVVDVPAQHGAAQTAPQQVRAGDHVEVVGHLVESADGAYRGGARRIDAGPGVLYVLGGSRQWNRRLLVAGLVELAAAAVFVAAPLSLIAYWLVARWHLG